MQTLRYISSRKALLGGVLVGTLLLIPACAGSPQSQQQVRQKKANLKRTLQHGKSIGVRASALQPIVKQEGELSNTSAPFTFFNDQPDTDYNTNLAIRYQQLEVQAEGVISTVTDQYSAQAEQDMHNFQSALSAQRLRNAGNTQAFVQEYTTDTSLLATAQYPKDYATISNDAQAATGALDVLGTTYTQLTSFQNTINQMQAARLDVTAMQSQYRSDMDTFNRVTTSVDFQNLGTLINVQYQEAVVNSIQALPFVSTANLAEFQTQLGMLTPYAIDSSSYLSLYNADRPAMKKANTIHDYLLISQKIDTDVASMHDDTLQRPSHYLINA